MNELEGSRRLDLHNASINFAAAIDGRCGFTHLDSGRTCHLPHGHVGPCDLTTADPTSVHSVRGLIR